MKMRPLRVFAVLALASAIAACRPAPSSAENAAAAGPPAAGTTAAVAAATECPLTDFDAFAERFGREITFQELTTADPLTIERYDPEAQPEPRKVTTQVPLDDVTWPVMPDLARLDGRRYEATPTGDGMQIRIYTPDTSDQQTYHFGQAPCWQLQRVADDAI